MSQNAPLILAARYRRIVFFFARVLANLVLWELILPRLGLKRVVERTRARRLRQIATRYRALANELGGLLIKVGQFLSARVDVLPEEITSELAALQDEVRAETFDAIRACVETELNGALPELFAQFDAAPLAAASLGQVHRARLLAPSDGMESIVVKVQRPNIEAIVATDLAALRTLTRWLQHYPPIRKRANLPALLVEFTRVLEGELDYLAEGKNAETFAENFRDDPDIRVPRVIWARTTRRVLALEDVLAIKITDYAAITNAGIARAQVADRLFHTYLKQIFVDGFFHADPHPGNLFVAPRADSRWQLTFVDFGMVGRVSASTRAGLREMVIAVGTRDAARLVKGYQLLGVLLPSAELDVLEKMEAKLFERFWGMTMSELRGISFRDVQDLFHEFRGVMLAMPFQIPQDLILLGRTVAILSGMCTGIDSQFNVWQGLAPFAEKLLSEDGTGSRWEIIRDELGKLARVLIGLPGRVDGVLGQIERGEIKVRTPDLTEQMMRLEFGVQRMVGGIIFAALTFSGAQLYLGGEKIFAGALFVAAVIALIWVIAARAPTRR